MRSRLVLRGGRPFFLENIGTSSAPATFVSAEAGLALDPSFTIRRYRMNAFFGARLNDPVWLAKREQFYEGMRLASIPEV